MKRWMPLAALAISSALSLGADSCRPIPYEIDMTPHGAAFDRTFTRPMSRPATTAGYYAAPSTGEHVEVYRGRFTGATPAELGGSGRLVFIDSPLGSATLYLERFGGRTRESAPIVALAEEIERFTRDVETWIELEVPSTAERVRLRDFVRETVSPDLFELATRGLMYPPVGTPSGDGETEFGRTLQFLADARYFDPQNPLEGLSPDPSAWDITMTLIGRRLRRDQPESPGLPPALRSEADALASLRRAWPSLPSAKRWLSSRPPDPGERTPAAWSDEEWAQNLEQWRDESFPQLGSGLTLSLVSIFPGFGATQEYANVDQPIEVRLSLPTAPDASNGEWDAEARQVRWSGPLGTRGLLAFATWSDPDAEVQRDHLGSVRLAGSELVDHVQVYASLGTEDRAAWSQFVEQLTPAKLEALPSVLATFRLPSELGQEEAARSAALVEPLVRALESEAGAETETR